jgi:hypothetical protein
MRKAKGVGSRFRATIDDIGRALTENDSRPLSPFHQEIPGWVLMPHDGQECPSYVLQRNSCPGVYGERAARQSRPARFLSSHSVVISQEQKGPEGRIPDGGGGQRVDADLAAAWQVLGQFFRGLEGVEPSQRDLGGQLHIGRVHFQSSEFAGRRHDGEPLRGRIAGQCGRRHPGAVSPFGQVAGRAFEDAATGGVPPQGDLAPVPPSCSSITFTPSSVSGASRSSKKRTRNRTGSPRGYSTRSVVNSAARVPSSSFERLR